MEIIDTHTHLNFPQFHSDLEEVISRSWNAGLTAIINVGTDLLASQESINLASRYTNIYATVGLHPHYADDWRNQLDGLKQIARQPKIVAVGEIGLDYFRNLSAHENQIAAFTAQLRLALQLEKPIILHCRDAYTEMLALLETEYIPHLKGRIPGIIHSFAAGPAYAQRFLKLGFYIGLNNMVTYSTNASLQESIKLIPLDRIVLETDCPYLPPAQLKGGRSEPMHIVDVARKIAEVKEVAIEEVESVTSHNAKEVFNINA